MSSLEWVSPGIRPLFFNQKMAANDPEKKIPSTAANATNLSPVNNKCLHLYFTTISSHKLRLVRKHDAHTVGKPYKNGYS